MITGSTAWNNAIANPNQKSLAATLEFPSFSTVTCSFNPSLCTRMPGGAMNILIMPEGTTQSIDETLGNSSVGTMTVDFIDPGNTLKPVITSSNFIGTTAIFKLGFQGLDYVADFVTLHTMQVASAGWTSDGRITIKLVDYTRYNIRQLLTWGGPQLWVPGQQENPQPAGPTFTQNFQPIGNLNPLWIQGNPIDILLVLWQNYLGLGQTPSSAQTTWRLYKPPDATTLINPNPYIDVTGILALRNNYFSGDWMEFKFTSPTAAKGTIEDQILKPLGLYIRVLPSGQMTLKSMKPPANQTPVSAPGGQWSSLNQLFTIGIPQVTRWPIINVVEAKLDIDKSDELASMSSRKFDGSWRYRNITSINQFNQEYIQQIESQGLQTNRGGLFRMGLWANRIFNRHAFQTPIYDVNAYFMFNVVEIGDLIYFDHPNVLDYKTGSIGISNVVCEVVNRKPSYKTGSANIKLQLADTRFMNFAPAWNIASNGESPWPGTGSNTEMFISDPTGQYTNAPTGPGRKIF